MNCDDYLKVQDLPDCWDAGAVLGGITIGANNTATYVFLKNLATGLINIVEVTSGASGEILIPMDNVAPLYTHQYEVTVIDKTDRTTYQLTVNSETGCAVRFKVHDANGVPGATLTLTTDACLVS